VHHILQCAGVPSLMGGNIGLPILSRDPLPAGGVYVLELSSYQIDLTYSLDCEVAVLLNVTPDHLDRYADFAAYRASKLRLFDMQSWKQTGVVATADPAVRKLVDALDDGPGIWRFDKSEGGALAHMARHEWPTLQGPHNAQNAWAAYCVTAELGVPQNIRDAALRTYGGLPHRMERVAEANGVLFVNDSKATNADSAAPALAAYPGIRWILGGQAKSADLDACAPNFGHVRSAYTIGEAGPMFAELLRDQMPVSESGTLEQAVRDAARDAESGDTVLLSPACASFDQFRDFEQRGDVFRELAQAVAKGDRP
jgi:UDP-N-acetylmuramoylalanine--D-glutamate ligase